MTAGKKDSVCRPGYLLDLFLCLSYLGVDACIGNCRIQANPAFSFR